MDEQNYEAYESELANSYDLNIIFKDMSGYYYNYKQKKLKKDTSIKARYCPLIVNRLIGYTTGALTNTTRLSKNPRDVISYKSTSAFSDLWKIFFDFRHECKLDNHCLRSRDGSFFIVDINKLAKVINDSYLWSIGGFTSEAKNKNWTVNENIDHVKAQKKKKYLQVGNIGKIPIPSYDDDEDEEEEEENE